MTRDLVVRPEAEAEIAAASDWYNQRRPGLGSDFIHAVNQTLTAIQDNPFQYQIVWREFRRAGVARFPYGLIYSVSEAEIFVLSCFHGRRNPNVWKKRT